MTDFREVFNLLTCAAVEARMDVADNKERARIFELSEVITRESLAAYLWKGYRVLRIGETIRWCGFSVAKIDGSHLRVGILCPGTRTKIYRSYLLSTMGEGLITDTLPQKKGKGVVRPHSLAPLVM